jgi:hypothetical protein
VSARGECGESFGAYRRHLADDEKPCDKCREFYQRYQHERRVRARKRRGNTEVVAALGVAAQGVQRINAHGSHPMQEFAAPPCPDPRCGEPMRMIREGTYECPNVHGPDGVERAEDPLGNRRASDRGVLA